MKDSEKFEGLKKKRIEENEEKYGKEIRERFGDETVDASNRKLQNMTVGQYEKTEKLAAEINATLAEAMKTCDPAGELAQKACALHKEWLCMYWPDGTYSAEAHRALAETYVDDPRFAAYYDKIAPGCAVFFRDALRHFCR